jgi:hypothetical protein
VLGALERWQAHGIDDAIGNASPIFAFMSFSIVLNLAEGHDYDFSRLYPRNLADAKGTVREVEAGIFVIRRCKYLPDEKRRRHSNCSPKSAECCAPLVPAFETVRHRDAVGRPST